MPRNYQVYMPPGKRVYNVYMPPGKRVYNAYLPAITLPANEFIRSPCDLTIGTSEVLNEWFSITGADVVANLTKWDVTDDSASYESIDQLCEVSATGGAETWRVEILVDKDPAPTAFIQCRVGQYSEYQIGGTQTLIADNSSNFKLDDGQTAERLNPGGITNYVEDLTTQWKFILEFNKLAATEVIRIRFYPAIGNSWPNEVASASGTATVECINGYRDAYSAPVPVLCSVPNNLISQPIDMSNWTTPGSTIITPNAALSPDLTQNANFVSLTSGDLPSQLLDNGVAAITVPITLSVWIKKITSSVTSVRLAHPTSINFGRWDINLAVLGNDWEQIDSNHPAVNETNPWFMVDGNIQIEMDHFSGTSPVEFNAWCWSAVSNNLLSQDEADWAAHDAIWTTGQTWQGRNDVWLVEDNGVFRQIYQDNITLENGVDYIYEADVYGSAATPGVFLIYQDGAWAEDEATNSKFIANNFQWEKISLTFTAIGTLGAFTIRSTTTDDFWVDPATIVLRKA